MKKNQVGKIHNFSIGTPKVMTYGKGKEINTGIRKETVQEAFLTKNGFQGDGVADLRFHGGPDRAVCMYPYEHYALWEQQFKTVLPPAAFGENLTVSNMLEKDVHIGDIFRVGDAVIQITQSRIPCSTITKRTNIPLLLKKIVETGYTGYLCRVLEEGIVKHDSEIVLLESHPKKVSVLLTNELYFHRPKDLESLKEVLAIPELAAAWRDALAGRVAKLENAKSKSI